MTKGRSIRPEAYHHRPSAAWRAALRRRLMIWYAKHARSLPWRRARPQPYHVWLSEIMLQQTQVATVRPYFQRFVAELPTIESLAAAPEERVLRLWEGLGYYRRARQLHAAAHQIVREHGGRFPHDPDAVRALPGIGRYTAGAILSIAFGQRQPILEANTRRLYARLLALREDPTSKSGEDQLWTLAADLLPVRRVGDFNQALMELGSQICTPRAPQCDACPLLPLCPTALAGLQAEIPLRKRKPRATSVQAAAVAIHRGGRVLLIRRQGQGRFDGLWDFPRIERTAAPAGPAAKRQLADDIEALCGVRPIDLKLLTTIKHTITRFRISLECYTAKPCDVARSARRVHSATLRWVGRKELSELPLSATGRQIADLLQPVNA